MIPLDPISALEGLEKAVSLVKKAQAVAKDIGGLSVMVGFSFGRKKTAPHRPAGAGERGHRCPDEEL